MAKSILRSIGQPIWVGMIVALVVLGANWGYRTWERNSQLNHMVELTHSLADWVLDDELVSSLDPGTLASANYNLPYKDLVEEVDYQERLGRFLIALEVLRTYVLIHSEYLSNTQVDAILAEIASASEKTRLVLEYREVFPPYAFKDPSFKGFMSDKDDELLGPIFFFEHIEIYITEDYSGIQEGLGTTDGPGGLRLSTNNERNIE